MLDRRLPLLEKPAQVDGCQQPAADLGELEVGPVLLWIAGRQSRLHAGRGRHGTEAAAEVQAYVGLALFAPSEGASPTVRVEQQGKREGHPEEAGKAGGEPAAGARVVHGG